MSNEMTTVLYALTTLAQSCAALAAFVGAVGVFRLQMLRDERNTAEHDLRGLAGQAGVFGRDEAFWVSTERIVEGVDRVCKNLNDKSYLPFSDAGPPQEPAATASELVRGSRGPSA